MSNEVEIVVKARDRSAAGLDSAVLSVRAAAVKMDAEIKRLKERLASMEAQKLKIDADTTGAETKLTELKAKAESATGDVKVKVDADIAKAEAKLKALAAKRVRIDADTAAANMKLEELKHHVDRTATSAEKLQERLRELGTKGLSPLLTMAGALGPALLPVLGQAVTITGSLANSFAGAGAAAGVFGAVIKSTFGEVKEASDKSDALREKIRLLGREAALAGVGSELGDKALKSRAKAILELRARMSLLPPATRAVVMSFQDMKSAWENFKDDNQATSFGILTRVFKLAQEIIPKLQPLFNEGATAVARLLYVFEQKVKDGGVERLIKWLADHATDALSNTVAIFTNLARAVANFMKATDDGGGALHWVEQMTEKLADFTQSTAFADFLQWVHDNGSRVGEALMAIAKAAVKIALATAPLAPISLAVATALANIIAAIPEPVLTGIVAAIIAWSVAMKVATVAAMALNLVLDANPIGILILAIAALVAGLIYAYKHSQRFRNIVDDVAGAVSNAGKAVWNFSIGIAQAIAKGVAFVIDRLGDMATFAGNVMSHIPGLGAAGAALKRLGASAHTAAQKVLDVAAAMEGVKSKTVTLRVQTLTSRQMIAQAGGFHEGMAHGGIVGRAAGGGPRTSRTLVGENGPELVDLAPGSTVHSNPDTERMLGGSGGAAKVVLEINSGGSAMDDLIVQIIRKAVRVRGGTVQDALGR